MKPKYLLSIIVGIILVGLATAMLLFANRPSDPAVDLPIQQDIREVGLAPEDDVTLPARYYASPGAVEDRGVLLLHMLGSSQNAWSQYAEQLQQSNFEVITFDFRGHGGATGDWHEFTDEDFQGLLVDARDAISYMHDINADMEIIIVGASIGANVGIQLAAEEELGVSAVVALSPSKNYHGIQTTEPNSSITAPIYYVVSEADNQSYTDTVELHAASQSELSELVVYPKSGHGTKLLRNEAELGQHIIDWINLLP